MRRWAIEFQSQDQIVTHSKAKSNDNTSLTPYGWSDFQIVDDSSSSKSKVNNAELKLKKAWELAQSPAKSIFMTLFMAWMSGSSVNIFSIMITIYSFINPVKAIMSVNAAFSRFEDPTTNLLLPKLTFVAINLVTVAIAIYKCYVLGLLPVTTADYVSRMSVIETTDFSAGFIQ